MPSYEKGNIPWNIGISKSRINKVCPKCNNEHNMKGTFCSRTCANSRKFTQESILKKSRANSKFWASLSEEEKSIILKNRRECSIKYNITKIMNRDWDMLGYSTKRERVFVEQQYHCNKCGNTEWLGQPINLTLEHKDGDHNNNIRSNLVGLCPNCHSQTETWCGRKNGNKYKRMLERNKIFKASAQESGGVL